MKVFITGFIMMLALLGQPACGPSATTQNPSSTRDGGRDKPPSDEPRGTQTGGGPKKKNSPPPFLLGNLTSFPALGNFSYDRRLANGNIVIRYKNKNMPMTRNEFITLLAQADKDGQDFRALVNKSIAQLPVPSIGKGYQLQSPLINAATSNDAFYFVAYPDVQVSMGGGTQFVNYLRHCDPPPRAAVSGPDYLARFHRLYAVSVLPNFIEIDLNDPLGYGAQKQGAVIFKGGYDKAKPGEIMVSPCPFASKLDDVANKALGHIYTFTVETDADPSKQKLAQSFWYAVGKAARSMFDGVRVSDLASPTPHQKSELYLSAHGHGIYYLHFRLENTPAHYNQIAALRTPQPSRDYYALVFP